MEDTQVCFSDEKLGFNDTEYPIESLRDFLEMAINLGATHFTLTADVECGCYGSVDINRIEINLLK